VFYTHNLISEFPVTGCPEIKMRNILKNRTALSTVVTTLIILVVSVLLAGIVTYFAINVTSTRVQEENLHLTRQHVWYDAAGTHAESAIMVVNTGGRDVVFDKIAIRGQASDWTNVFYVISSTPVTGELLYTPTLANNTLVYGSDANYTAYVASNAITLKSGYTMLVYVESPDSISVNDVGLTVAISIFSSQAIYYKETNVEAV
jgi:hypothetical protein